MIFNVNVFRLTLLWTRQQVSTYTAVSSSVYQSCKQSDETDILHRPLSVSVFGRAILAQQTVLR